MILLKMSEIVLAYEERNLPAHSLISISARFQEAATPLCVFEGSPEQQLASATPGVEVVPARSELLASLEQQLATSFSEQHGVSCAVPEAAPIADGSQQLAASPFSPFPSFAMST